MGLILTWAIIISFIIIMYVLLDGFDLGIGILFPFIKNHEHHDIMMSTVSPVWDGNETWLVFGAAALYGSFPLAYGTLLPLLYMPIMVMLAALIFRGVAFEFRFKAHKSRFIWDVAFAAGSICAAFMQGIILGTFIKGYGTTLPISVPPYHWITSFSLMTGVAVVFGYALLGATWLIMRTIGVLQLRMFILAKILLAVLVLFLIIVSLWTPLMDNFIFQRWFSFPNFFYLSPLPLLTGIVILINFYSLHKRWEILPFVLTIALFIFSYIGFCISSWPYIIPRSVTIWAAAAEPSSLIFTLVGTAILVPLLIVYTLYSYRVFRGKVTKSEHY